LRKNSSSASSSLRSRKISDGISVFREGVFQDFSQTSDEFQIGLPVGQVGNMKVHEGSWYFRRKEIRLIDDRI
jgi:hypothetical protein